MFERLPMCVDDPLKKKKVILSIRRSRFWFAKKAEKKFFTTGTDERSRDLDRRKDPTFHGYLVNSTSMFGKIKRKQ